MIVQLEDFKKYTGVYDDDENYQSLYLDSALNIIENYLGYKLETGAPLIQVFSGDGSNKLSLRAKPILSVLAITTSEFNGVPEVLTSGQFITLTNDSDIKTFPKGTDNITVTYTAGYDEDTLPAIIKLTAFRIAALLQTESDNNIGVTSKSFGDEGSRTYVQTRKYADYLIQLSSYKLF